MANGTLIWMLSSVTFAMLHSAKVRLSRTIAVLLCKFDDLVWNPVRERSALA